MPGRDWEKPEILVLAADEVPRKAFERALCDHGYEPFVAHDPDQATALAGEHSFELGVVDTQETNLSDAIDLTERLLANNPAARMIVIHDVGTDLASFNGSADRIRLLSRPFSMLEFISSVDDALSLG